MSPLDEKQQQRVDGILACLNDLLDKRFAQARRVNPLIANVERDLRQLENETINQVLSGGKGFGPIKLVVADIFSSGDEAKKRALMSPTDQVSLMNEIVPADKKEGAKEQRVGQLEIRDIKTLFTALNPSLEKILVLVQTWIWWDLRDAADLYRFNKQEERIKQLKARDPDAELVEYYRQEMNIKAGVDIDRKQMIIFELQRITEIIELFVRRRHEDEGYQTIIVSAEREEHPEADAICVRLARRLKTIETARAQSDPLEQNVREFYAPKLNIPVTRVDAQAVLDYERKMGRIEREQLADALFRVASTGETGDYKKWKLRDMQQRFDALCKSLGVNPDAVRQATASAHAGPAAPEEGKKEEKGKDAQGAGPVMF